MILININARNNHNLITIEYVYYCVEIPHGND